MIDAGRFCCKPREIGPHCMFQATDYLYFLRIAVVLTSIGLNLHRTTGKRLVAVTALVPTLLAPIRNVTTITKSRRLCNWNLAPQSDPVELLFPLADTIPLAATNEIRSILRGRPSIGPALLKGQLKSIASRRRQGHACSASPPTLRSTEPISALLTPSTHLVMSLETTQTILRSTPIAVPIVRMETVLRRQLHRTAADLPGPGAQRP
jgi:hypothetical protein